MYRDKTMKKIAVIPAYEPDETLINVASEAMAAGFTVVVVDDGSETGKAVKDGTASPETFHKIFEDTKFFAHVIRYPENRGKGYAMKTAFSYITKNYEENYTVVVIDSDGQHKVSDAIRLTDYAASHRDTLVLGSRKQGAGSPLRSRIGNGITRNLFSMMSGVRVYDTQTGLRAFSDELIGRMLVISGDRYEYEMNMLMDFARDHMKIVELPIETIYIDNNSGSHFNAIKDSFRIYRELFKFSASSFAGFLIDYGIFGCIVGLFGPAGSVALFANVFARIISATANYSINRNFVFTGTDDEYSKKEKAGKVDAVSGGRYACLALLILVFNTLILYVLSEKAGITPLRAKIVTECIMFIFSFLIQKNFVFGTRKSLSSKDPVDHRTVHVKDTALDGESGGKDRPGVKTFKDYSIA